MQLGRAPEAVATYRSCAKGCGKDPALQSELSNAIEHCTLQWLAQASSLHPTSHVFPPACFACHCLLFIFRRPGYSIDACPMTYYLMPLLLLQQWARQIAIAQKPILLSKRDGRLLKPVPSELRLKPEKLQLCLESALASECLAAEARKLLCIAWGKGKSLPNLPDVNDKLGSSTQKLTCLPVKLAS